MNHRLVRTLKTEQELVEILERIGFTAEQAIGVMTDPALAKMESSNNVREPTDYYDVRSDLVIWLNNLEKDKRYKAWSKNMMDVRRILFPPHFCILTCYHIAAQACLSRPIESNCSKHLQFGDDGRPCIQGRFDTHDAASG